MSRKSFSFVFFVFFVFFVVSSFSNHEGHEVGLSLSATDLAPLGTDKTLKLFYATDLALLDTDFFYVLHQ
jgi:hypothetical protein